MHTRHALPRCRCRCGVLRPIQAQGPQDRHHRRPVPQVLRLQRHLQPHLLPVHPRHQPQPRLLHPLRQLPPARLLRQPGQHRRHPHRRDRRRPDPAHVNFPYPRLRNDWDYRWMDYPPRARNRKHPNDQSLATYEGHSVLRTLIRCYFSPAYSTGQKYVYTGSSDSSVYIYDVVTGAQVARLEYHDDPVRDCSWHPFFPTLVSSSWDGVIAEWEFSGRDKLPVPLEATSTKTKLRGLQYHISSKFIMVFW